MGILSTIKPRWGCSYQLLPLLKSLHSIYSWRRGVKLHPCSRLPTIHWVPSCLEVTGTQYAIYLLTTFHLEKLGSRRTLTTLPRSLHIFAVFVDSSESHIHKAVKWYIEEQFLTRLQSLCFFTLSIHISCLLRFGLLLLMCPGGLYLAQGQLCVLFLCFWHPTGCVPFRWNWRDPSRQMDFSISVVYISRQHCSWM